MTDASGHQQAYKELLAHVDAGHALTLETVQHVIFLFSRSKSFTTVAACRYHRVPQVTLAAASEALIAGFIATFQRRILRISLNASNFGASKVSPRRLVSSQLCYTVTTWHPSKFSSKLAVQISMHTIMRSGALRCTSNSFPPSTQH
jgi:hypothetical protein